MIFVFGNGNLEEVVRKAVERVQLDTKMRANDYLKSVSTIEDLQRQISKLEIERDKRQEVFDRMTREIEHKVGLERKRQEFEIEQAKREATVGVQEENLKADKDRFKNEMEFQRNMLDAEIKSLRELVGQLLARVPSAEIFASLSPKEQDHVRRHDK